MTERFHVGLAVLSVVFVGIVLTARWWATPVAESGPYDDDHDTVITPLADLMSAWEQEPVYGIALELARGERS
jgi:nitrogen fixation-related uncharacterized protein